MNSPLIDSLIQACQCLPGVGPKSAQRMVFHLLERDRDGGKVLAQALASTMQLIKNCSLCRNLTENTICNLCVDTARDKGLLCVVETPANVVAIEHTLTFKGQYFVLMGHLSPIDGIGPEEIGIPLFKKRIIEENLREIILATNPTVEGEATAYYLAELAKKQGIQVTRIAHGVPLGGDLDYVDGSTLTRALHDRSVV